MGIGVAADLVTPVGEIRAALGRDQGAIRFDAPRKPPGDVERSAHAVTFENSGAIVKCCVRHVVEGEGHERRVGYDITGFRRETPDQPVGDAVDKAVDPRQSL